MYPVLQTVAALFDAEQRQLLKITGVDKNRTPINITDADVILDSFSIDRYSCNGYRIEIGTAISSELRFRLDNADGRFDSIVFEGTELFVEIGIADWTLENPTVTWIPCGYFTPDEQPRTRTIITLSALDRMMRFDAVAPTLTPWTTESGAIMTNELGETLYFCADLVFPADVASIVDQICVRCGVELAESVSGMPNADLVIENMPQLQQDVTFRNMIQWCAGLMGSNAWMDWQGKLRFSWYNDADYTSTMDRRYSSDLYENDITITGVSYTDSENTVHNSGSAYYALDLSGNAFIAELDDTMLSSALYSVYLKVRFTKYRPCEASVIAAPWLYPMDRIVFRDANNADHYAILTNVNFSINGTTAIKSIGESEQTASYAPPSGLTKAQTAALRRVLQASTDALESAVDAATKQITGAENSNVKFVYDADGHLSEILVMDTDDIATARNVWRWNSGGLGHSSNGYGGPYSLAMTQDGSIVATMITSGTLNAGVIKAGIIQDVAGLNYWNMATGDFKLSSTSTVGDRTVSDLLDDVDATITGVDVEYAQNQSTTTAPTTGWSTTAPQWQDGYYIWQRTATTTPDGTTYSNPVCISGRDGQDGSAGAQGIGVSAIVEEYYLSTSDSTQTGGSWSTSQPAWVSGKYIWTRSAVTWTDNTTTYTSPVLAQAINGANQTASSASAAVTALDNSLTQQEIFNRLTNNGQTQGIYLQNGLLYINASYIQSGYLSANLISNGVMQGEETSDSDIMYVDLNDSKIYWRQTVVQAGGPDIVYELLMTYYGIDFSVDGALTTRIEFDDTFGITVSTNGLYMRSVGESTRHKGFDGYINDSNGNQLRVINGIIIDPNS